jgi:ABC-2 type transport system ATP-binding protein
MYDGPLRGITERFGNDKLVKLRFADETPDDAELARFGEVIKREGPTVDLKVDRSEVAAMLGAILDGYAVDDVSVVDPPLEQVIARVFEEGKAAHDAA